MKLTVVTILIILCIMCFIQLCYRDNFSALNQEKFRKDHINYQLEKYLSLPTDGREVRCMELGPEKKKLVENSLCEGNQNMGGTPIESSSSKDYPNIAPRKLEATEYSEKIETCNLLNKVGDWRERIQKIPVTLLEGGKGCGFCFDNKTVMYGDENGPFFNIGVETCNNWIKPGDPGIGGSKEKKNVFASYPEPIKSFMDLFRSKKNQGVQADTQKMYEQEICSGIKNVGQLEMHTDPTGKQICGWCFMGRRGDGEGEGMVLSKTKPNTPKYDDDYCPWPREIDKEGNGYIKTKFYNTTNTRELKMWNTFKKLTASGFKSDKASEKARKTKGKDNLIAELESIIKDDPKINMNKYKEKNITSRSKLLVNQSEAEALDQLFPCFVNFKGDKKNESGLPLGHTDECYNDMWGYMTPTCTGDAVSRIKKSGLPLSKTFSNWNKGYIPSVETGIGNIQDKAEKSNQYAETYSENTKNFDIERLSSAKLNNMACFGILGDPCEDKYRNRKFKYKRPKECIKQIFANVNNDKKLTGDNALSLDDRYEPTTQITYKYYWPIIKDYTKTWKDGVFYDWSNEEYTIKLKEKVDIYLSIDSLKNGDSTYKPKGTKEHKFDDILLSALYLYNSIENRRDRLKIWKDNIGGTKKPDGSLYSYVKLCYEDFISYLKVTWAPTDDDFITKMGTVDVSNYEVLKNKILKYNDLLSINQSDINIKVELDQGKYITKDLYEHPWFPFWRLLPEDYYITSLYQNIERTTQDERRTPSCGNYIDESTCNSNSTCNFFSGKCYPKLVKTRRIHSYSEAEKQCGKKYAGRLYNYSKYKNGKNYLNSKITGSETFWLGSGKKYIASSKRISNSKYGTLKGVCEKNFEST